MENLYMKAKKIELLAPAGDLESFYNAINNGADAVYISGNKFGARAYDVGQTTRTVNPHKYCGQNHAS